MQALAKRHIAPGTKYNRFFPQIEPKLTTVTRNVTIDNTVEAMEYVARKYQRDTALIAQELKAHNLKKTLSNIWHFVYQHIQYKLDTFGHERIERPAAAWEIREEGIDCDGYAVFISSILLNLNIPHFFKITKYKGKENWQHVYVIVPSEQIPNSKNQISNDVSQRSNVESLKPYYTLDPVKDQFNAEEPFITDQKLIPMGGETFGVVAPPANYGSSPLNQLSGIIQTKTPNTMELNILSGIENSSKMTGFDDDLIQSKTVQERVLKGNSQAFVTALPIVQALAQQSKAYLDFLDRQGLSGLGNTSLVESLLEPDEVLLVETMIDELTGEVYGVDRADNVWLLDVGEVDLEGLGLFKKIRRSISKSVKAVAHVGKKVGGAVIKTAGTVAKGVANTAVKVGKAAVNTAVDVTKFVTIPVRAPIKLAQGLIQGKSLKDSLKSTGKLIKDDSKPVLDAAGTAIRFLNRYLNPATILIRNGFLLGMKINFLGVAKKLRWSYISKEQFIAKGGSSGDYGRLQKGKNTAEDIYRTIGGKNSNLKAAILNGKGNDDDKLKAIRVTTPITEFADEEERRILADSEGGSIVSPLGVIGYEDIIKFILFTNGHYPNAQRVAIENKVYPERLKNGADAYQILTDFIKRNANLGQVYAPNIFKKNISLEQAEEIVAIIFKVKFKHLPTPQRLEHEAKVTRDRLNGGNEKALEILINHYQNNPLAENIHADLRFHQYPKPYFIQEGSRIFEISAGEKYHFKSPTEFKNRARQIYVNEFRNIDNERRNPFRRKRAEQEERNLFHRITRKVDKANVDAFQTRLSLYPFIGSSGKPGIHFYKNAQKWHLSPDMMNVLTKKVFGDTKWRVTQLPNGDFDKIRKAGTWAKVPKGLSGLGELATGTALTAASSALSTVLAIVKLVKEPNVENALNVANSAASTSQTMPNAPQLPQVPQLQLPKVNLPKINVPKPHIAIPKPKIELPKLNLPQITLPNVNVPKPHIAIPQTKIELPKINVPRAVINVRPLDKFKEVVEATSTEVQKKKNEIHNQVQQTVNQGKEILHQTKGKLATGSAIANQLVPALSNAVQTSAAPVLTQKADADTVRNTPASEQNDDASRKPSANETEEGTKNKLPAAVWIGGTLFILTVGGIALYSAVKKSKSSLGGVPRPRASAGNKNRKPMNRKMKVVKAVV